MCGFVMIPSVSMKSKRTVEPVAGFDFCVNQIDFRLYQIVFAVTT